jgi:serine/threonine protein phosphatase 1
MMLSKIFGGSKRFPEERRVYAIGDVHGCASELTRLIAKLEIDRDTLVVFLGDYVDRGAHSRAVIDQVIELRSRCEVVALMGNHESMFIDFLEHPASSGAGLFILNGGAATLANYDDGTGSFSLPQTHVEFLNSLKIFHETQSHFFVHAGVPLKKALKALDPVADREVCLWTRGPFLTSTEDWGKLIVHGHTPVKRAEIHPNRVNIDSACVFGGSLSAFDCSNGKIISVARQPQAAQNELIYPKDNRNRIAVRFNGRMPVTAGLRGGARQALETLNYNQFGLLLREIPGNKGNCFSMQDIIDGVIGTDPQTRVEFIGQIVRVETRDSLVVYGVKLLKVTNGNGQWVDRPA